MGSVQPKNKIEPHAITVFAKALMAGHAKMESRRKPVNTSHIRKYCSLTPNLKQFFVSISFSMVIAAANVVALDVVLAREPAKATDRLTAPIDTIEPTAPGSHTYQLAMSKNNKLCGHILKLFNDDLAKYGYEQYEEHEEFRKIPWRDAQFSHENYGRIEYTPVKGALFDINNDGVKDFVVKWEASLSGVLRDGLYVLDREVANRSNKLLNRELFESKNQLDMGGILEPFIVDNKTYIYVRPLFELFPASRSKFSVVVSYGGGRIDNNDRSGKIDEFCQFRRVRTDKQLPN